LNNARGRTEVAITVFSGIDQSLAPSDLPQGLSSGNLNCAFQPGSVFTRPPLKRVSTLPGTAQIIYEAEFTKPDGTNVILQFTYDGKMWADGTQIGTTAAGNRFKVASMFGRAYIAISDGEHGADVPLQFDGTNLDRVSQDGPGAPPTFAATEISDDRFPISTITQPAPQNRGSSYFLQSAGVGNNTTAGNNVTVYYSDSTLAGPDTDLVNAFNSGFPVYIYFSFTGAPTTIGPVVALVTGIGLAMPPTQPRNFYYFTYTAATAALTYYQGSGHPGYTANYQRSLATVTTTVPVPGVSIGSNITISGTSVAAYNSSWSISQTPNSGTVTITQTSLTAGVATYSYSLVSGTAPIAGQEITITGTLNAGGTLNVTNGTIATASGGSSGTFTITGFSGPDFPSSSESGAGVTAGTEFCFDPGALVVGSGTDPIYGNAAGGFFIFSGSEAIVAPGARQGVVFFITRTGYTTIPSPIAKFTIPSNTNAIAVSNLPIGPSNVIARAVAFTGANGGKFFYLPVAPQLSGVVSGTSTVVNDNTSTTATFYFTDDALLAGSEIDIPGNDLFRQVVLGHPLAFFPYAGRLFAWGERNKVQSFLNMGFEGGVLASAPNSPLGWSISGTGTLTAGDYGLAWNPDAGAVISQTAYQDENGVAILQGGTQYTFRCWTAGTVTATISSASTGFSATAAVTASGGYAQADFSAITPSAIPSDLIISYSGALMDELEIIYTANPYLQIARASYIDNPEAFDGVTGLIGPANDPHAIRVLYLRRDVLHMLTYGPDGSLYETQDTASGEPVTWTVSQVAAKCGAVSVWGNARFEEWQVWASDTGLRIYDGGSVEKMSEEVQDWWDTFNPTATNILNVANDPYTRRIYISAPTGSSTTLNSTYVLDYRELNTSQAMANSTPLKIGFSGKMLTTDLTRKWSPWSNNLSTKEFTINHIGLLGSTVRFAGGGSLNAAVSYTLLEGDLTGIDDDYGAFDSFYITYFMLTAEEAEQQRLASNRKLFGPVFENVSGTGGVVVTPLLNAVSNPGPGSRITPVNAVSTYDTQFSLMAAGDRCAIKTEAVATVENGPAGFWLSGITVALIDHPFSIVRGWNG